MKRIFALCMAFAMFVTTSNAAFTESKTEKKESYGVFKDAETKAAAEFFVKMSRQDYEKLTGKHLSLFGRVAFKTQQKKVKMELKRAADEGTGSVVGFLLGLTIIGVLVVYLLTDNANTRKWAWIGAAVTLIVLIIRAL